MHKIRLQFSYQRKTCSFHEIFFLRFGCVGFGSSTKNKTKKSMETC